MTFIAHGYKNGSTKNATSYDLKNRVSLAVSKGLFLEQEKTADSLAHFWEVLPSANLSQCNSIVRALNSLSLDQAVIADHVAQLPRFRQDSEAIRVQNGYMGIHALQEIVFQRLETILKKRGAK